MQLKHTFLVSTLAITEGLAPGRMAAQSDAAERKRALKTEITPELRLAVSRGFQHLLTLQNPKGEFDDTYPVAVNALVGLAFLAGGFTERAGPAPYVEAMKRCTEALLARQNKAGYFHDTRSAMYGHGFATLYLAELYGTYGAANERIRDALERAVRVIEGAQSTAGGWDYGPGSVFQEGKLHLGASDTSISVCQTMALRAARNLGIRVRTEVVTRARDYITGAQNADGGFAYRKNNDRYFLESSAFPRSAAGVCILYSLGDYNTESIKKGFDYLERNYRFPWSNKFPYYAQYYSAQAMLQAGGRRWAEYFPWVRQALVEGQRPDGSWRASGHENDVQATAMSLIILQLPYAFLPIHER